MDQVAELPAELAAVVTEHRGTGGGPVPVVATSLGCDPAGGPRPYLRLRGATTLRFAARHHIGPSGGDRRSGLRGADLAGHHLREAETSRCPGRPLSGGGGGGPPGPRQEHRRDRLEREGRKRWLGSATGAFFVIYLRRSYEGLQVGPADLSQFQRELAEVLERSLQTIPRGVWPSKA